MIVVVAVMALAFGLLMTRGPMRSPALEMQASVSSVIQGLRVARSKAIAANMPVRFFVDTPSHAFRVENERPIFLPRNIGIAISASSEIDFRSHLPVVRFNGDGSATGSRIDVADGSRRARIAIEWLTGRVSVLDVR